MAIYNEIDPFAVRWLRNLISAGHIAPGVVDERSIKDLVPADVDGTGQRHFFAGIAGWSLALRLAGVPDDADVWTGSCPCQPFSESGARRGFSDERHLWPAWYSLIRECDPPVIFGEQVASDLGREWLDGVCADLEKSGYACAAANMCAAGTSALHVRQRICFVAYSLRARLARPFKNWRGIRRVSGSPPAIGGDFRLDARLPVHPDSVPAEPSDGFPRPVGFVRAVGNAVVPETLAAFIRAALEAA